MSEDASLNSPATRPTVTRLANAKLNLALAVGRPTPHTDGYHPIASWMVRIDLADDLTVTRLDDDRFSRYAIQWAADAPVRSPIDWSITKDLAVRAHLMLEHRVGRKLPVQLRLDKRIPVGGGLGGASADAAAMLIAVNEIHELGLSLDELASVGAQLGSDVPFCLGQHPAFVSGLGERIRAAPGVRADVLLVLPDFGCPTGRVYAEFDAAPSPALRADEIEAMAAGAHIDPAALFNDLTAPARRVAPRLGHVLEVLGDISDGLGAHVTGSGSTCFVVCPEGAHQARLIGDDVEAELGDVRTVVARIV